MIISLYSLIHFYYSDYTCIFGTYCLTVTAFLTSVGIAIVTLFIMTNEIPLVSAVNSAGLIILILVTMCLSSAGLFVCSVMSCCCWIPEYMDELDW